MKAAVFTLVALLASSCTGILKTKWGTFTYQSPADWSNPVKIENFKK